MAVLGTRCTLMVQNDTYLVTETHVSPKTSFSGVKPDFLAVFKARMALCGPPALPFRGRMSLVYAGANGKVRGQRTSMLLDAVDLASIGAAPVRTYNVLGATNVPNSADQAKSCFILRAYDATAVANHPIYMAAVPDVVIGENPVGPEISLLPGYALLLDAYKATLKAGGFGFIGLTRVDPAARTAVTAIENHDTDNLIGVSVNGALPSNVLGDLLMLRNFKMRSKVFATVNGRYPIQSVRVDYPQAGWNTAYLLGTANLVANNVQFLGTVERSTYQFYAYDTFATEQQTTRKRGGRPLASAGRRTRPARI